MKYLANNGAQVRFTRMFSMLFLSSVYLQSFCDVSQKYNNTRALIKTGRQEKIPRLKIKLSLVKVIYYTLSVEKTHQLLLYKQFTRVEIVFLKRSDIVIVARLLIVPCH